jgi:hypothetical protein
VTLRLPLRGRDAAEGGDRPGPRRWRADAGTVLLAVVALAFLLMTLPVILKGEPLADDFYSCIRHTEVGVSGALHQSWIGTGAVRPARFLEILLLASLCGRIPFGLIMLVPLGLTLAVAWLLRGLLRDLGLPTPWPEVGAAMWLLYPLGAESALWPSALHVPLGMALALGSLRIFRRERLFLGAVLALAAFLSLEQTIFALPLAAFLVTPKRGRKSLIATGAIALVVLMCFSIWPGENERTAVSLSHRVTSLFREPVWYAKFPVAGLGLHSIPLAVWWALPFSLVVLGVGGWLGFRLGRTMPGEAVQLHPGDERSLFWIVAVAGVLALLVNLPEIATVPRGVSGRIFAPTWLLLAATLPLIVHRTRLPRIRWFWIGSGVFAAGALLSLALCVEVRLHTADFTRASSDYIAARLDRSGEVVAVCGVRRTVVTPAPVGSFAINEFIYDWSAQYALKYHTGESASFVLGGPLWATDCPDLAGADLVVHFEQLRAAAGLDR